MQNKKFNYPLVFSIIFAALMISISILYLGSQLIKDTPSQVTQADIEKDIDEYIKKQKEKANEPTYSSVDISDDDAFLGDINAPVIMVEFSDFQCPYCRKFYSDTLPSIKEKYIDTGKVKFVYRDFPLSSHKSAFPAALASECARDQGGDEVYFAMHDKIFDGQNKLGSGTVEIPEKALKSYAEDLNLNMKEFSECYDNQKFKQEIHEDLIAGQNAGINGTPGFIINGLLVPGAQKFSIFDQLIKEALKNSTFIK